MLFSLNASCRLVISATTTTTMRLSFGAMTSSFCNDVIDEMLVSRGLAEPPRIWFIIANGIRHSCWKKRKKMKSEIEKDNKSKDRPRRQNYQRASLCVFGVSSC